MKKNLLTLLCAILLGFTYACAESTVYVFVKDCNSSTINAFVDGKKVCHLNGPIKKTMDGNGMFKKPYTVAYPTFRKLVFDKEGKVVLSVEQDFVNCMNLKHTLMKGEIQLDLEDGETYYINVKGKGINDIQLKMLEAKKAEKNLSDKKWKELPAVNVNL